MTLGLSLVLEMKAKIYVVLLRVLFFQGGLAVRCMDFRFLDLYYHQFLVILVYLLNLLLRYDEVFLGCYCDYCDYYLMTQFLRSVIMLLNQLRVGEIVCMLVLVLLMVLILVVFVVSVLLY